jgi:hypothetical protein
LNIPVTRDFDGPKDHLDGITRIPTTSLAPTCAKAGDVLRYDGHDWIPDSGLITYVQELVSYVREIDAELEKLTPNVGQWPDNLSDEIRSIRRRLDDIEHKLGI